MKKKFGFTLAEVLITLGIIGVVAALTAPALVKNSGQAKIGPALAKFVNTFETGIETMMTEEGVSKISMPDIQKLSNYIIMTPMGEDSTYTYTDAQGNNAYTISLQKWKDIADNCNNPNYNGEKSDAICNSPVEFIKNGGMVKAQLKDGSIMIIGALGATDTLNEGVHSVPKGSYKGIIAEILYDINGEKTVNKAGRDVFGFLLDASGILIPVGSNAQNYIDYKNDSLIFGGGSINNAVSCDITSNIITRNISCTGKIADNGWKADY